MDDSQNVRACWGRDPERIDPDDYPPGSPFVRQMTWAECAACAIQVHIPVQQFLMAGLRCPGCGAGLLAPPEDREEWLQRVLREEDDLTEQL